MLQDLFENSVVLQGLLAEKVGLFKVLFVDLLYSLVVVGFWYVPTESAPEVIIACVHPHENLLEVLCLILRSLIVQKKPQPRKIGLPTRYQRLSFCWSNSGVVEDTIDGLEFQIEEVELELLQASKLLLLVVCSNKLTVNQQLALCVVWLKF